ncbi:MAG: SMP-30/gluconolactonase/LRE family protein [Acidithiobacillus sp.]|uniref:SMP-30/gluconolactonase/LRE family protein n=1 Tax=Acidithiobacillus sp. TaxID=1872118 RepID=UPI003D040D61
MEQPQSPSRKLGHAEVVWPLGAILGEGPLWSPRHQAVYFVDILGQKIAAFWPASGTKGLWALEEPCTWLVEYADDDLFLAGLRRDIVSLRLEEHGVRLRRRFPHPEPEHAHNRFNDAKADPWGRVWAGTMDDDEKRPTGALYRISGQSMARVDAPYVVSNGPAFSADGHTLYHSDSALRRIYAFDLSAQGEIRHKRLHIQFTETDGYPDGMTGDEEGGLWVAHFGGGRVTRFDTEGRATDYIELPTPQVTSLCFGGPQHRDLYITTAARGRPEDPQAGHLYHWTVPYRGLPHHAYRRHPRHG